MKRKNLLLLPLFMLVLAGCKTPSSSEPPASTSDEPPPSATSRQEEQALVRTIAELRAMTTGNDSASTAQKEQLYETSGIVTAKFRGANYDSAPAWNISIQDGDHALLLYALTEATYAADFASVAIGEKLTVQGHLATYNGLRELDRVKFVKKEAATAVTPEVLDDIAQAKLAGKDSKLVKIEGLKLTRKPTLTASMGTNSDGTPRSNITVNMTFKKGESQISTYMHYNIPMADAEAAVAKLQTITSNSTVAWTGILGMNSGTYQLTNAHESEWDIVVGDPVVATALSFSKEAVALVAEETEQLVLAATPFDAPLASVSYASSAPEVATVNEEGLVTAVSAGTANITATLGALTASVAVTVTEAGGEVTSYVVKPVKADLGTDKNIEITSAETVAKHISGLPEGTTFTGSKFYASTGGGSSSTDTMPASYTVFKFSTSKDNGNAKFTFPEGTEISDVTVKGRGWNTDAASLEINGVTKDFTNAEAANKEDIRTFEYELPAVTNVVEFKSTKRVILTEIVFHFAGEEGGEVTPPGPVEHFSSLPAGHTSIANIVSEGVIATEYVTRGVILGTNGGAFYIQDPISGASLGGFGLNATAAIKPLLKPGVVVDVSGPLKVNNNGKQIDPAVVTVVAEENLSAVAPFVISTAVEFAAAKAEADLSKHARLVKIEGLKVTGLVNKTDGTYDNKFTVSLGEETATIAVNYMDSADAASKGRTQIKALLETLIVSEGLIDIQAVQLATSTAGTWTFNLGTLDYITVRPA